jgi:hypothetical protein
MMLYNAMYMAGRRLQIDLTAQRRKRLDERRRRERRTALNSTFGALPNLVVPRRGEWERA